MAFRMQASVPELTDLTKEPASTFELYGDEAKKPGSFANSALMARRLVGARRALRADLPQQLGPPLATSAGRMPDQCKDIDQPIATA